MSAYRYILCLLAVLLTQALQAETVKYTVKSYHEVIASGEEPLGASAEFMSDTRSSSRISAGHSARLDLYGFDGCRIQSITLYMSSNKSSGAGALQVQLGDSLVSSIPDCPFNDEAWNGAYVSDSLVRITIPITQFVVPENECLSVIVTASVNSLYFGACEIQYTMSALRRHIVLFATGTGEMLAPKRESEIGKGIILPDLQDADSVWHFLGWTESVLAQTPVCPVYYKAGTRYYPTKNLMLYALYSNEITDASIVQETTLQSGTYALVMVTGTPLMMCGYVDDERITTCEVKLRFGADSLYHLQMATVPRNSRYQLSFTETNKTTFLHEASNTYIGYSTSTSSHRLRSFASEWDILPTANATWQFYHDLRADSTAYCLYPQYLDGFYYFKDTQLLLKSSAQYMLLFPVPETEPQPALYTTNPPGAAIVCEPQEHVYRVYRLDGTCIQSSASAEFLTHLPRGLYIISSPTGTQKRVVL